MTPILLHSWEWTTCSQIISVQILIHLINTGRYEGYPTLFFSFVCPLSSGLTQIRHRTSQTLAWAAPLTCHFFTTHFKHLWTLFEICVVKVTLLFLQCSVSDKCISLQSQCVLRGIRSGWREIWRWDHVAADEGQDSNLFYCCSI